MVSGLLVFPLKFWVFDCFRCAGETDHAVLLEKERKNNPFTLEMSTVTLLQHNYWDGGPGGAGPGRRHGPVGHRRCFLQDFSNSGSSSEQRPHCRAHN